MSVKLKPCPFCGGDDVTVKGAEITGPNPYVYCRKCHTHGPQRISYQGAANAWNFRADEPKRIDGKLSGMSAGQFDACYEEDDEDDNR